MQLFIKEKLEQIGLNKGSVISLATKKQGGGEEVSFQRITI